PPPPPGGGVHGTPVCAKLTMSKHRVKVGLRTTVRVRVINDNGRPMRRVRVIARGAGVRTGARTGAAGYARLTLRPQRVGVIRIRVVGSTRCVARVRAVAIFKAAAELTG
ncbi:MAG: hypothetical protein M3304_08415, partial [Actinomycetota bacterium]|nr:hypothetical protein [Actinomycetota bacterium]